MSDSEEGQPGVGRVEAFSDGVLAIIITIMVLELKAPHEASFEARMGWWSPMRRGVLELDDLRITRSLIKSARRYTTTIDAAFDEVLGFTQSLTGNPGMTGTLTIRYRKPTPLYTELRFEARVLRVEGRKIFVEMRLCDGAELLADGEGLFVLLKPGQP